MYLFTPELRTPLDKGQTFIFPKCPLLETMVYSALNRVSLQLKLATSFDVLIAKCTFYLLQNRLTAIKKGLSVILEHREQ